MRIKTNVELCAVVASAATQVGYEKGRQGHAQRVFDIVVLTHGDVSMRTVRKCLQQFAQNGQCTPKNGKQVDCYLEEMFPFFRAKES